MDNFPAMPNENKHSRKALGRGLQAILAEQSHHNDGYDQLEEHVKAARIGAAILELVSTVEARYQPVIFKRVEAYRAVSNQDSIEEIGQKLFELEHRRNQRDQANCKPKRRWYFLYLR